MQWGVYIHIPFCRQKCFYCDFPSYAGREQQMKAYTEALCQEIAIQGLSYRQKWGRPATVYIGGGTPTALPAAYMTEILTAIAAHLGTDVPEFTVECNPGTVDRDYFKVLQAGGVNRLSFGVQSFNDKLLKRIGRIHSVEEAVAAVRAAQQAGFTNLSVDLMYGLPGQTLQDVAESIAQAQTLAVQHISIYGLQLEEGTVFARQESQGRLVLPADDETEAMYDYINEKLPQLGFARYEVSNFARPGKESRHNLGYWQDVPYLGLGAAAHSYLEGRRYENTADIAAYINRINTGASAGQLEEEPTPQHIMEEFAFLALRTAEGLSREKFAAKFNRELSEVYGRTMSDLAKKGLLTVDEKGCHLTAKGFKYGNWVFAEFLL